MLAVRRVTMRWAALRTVALVAALATLAGGCGASAHHEMPSRSVRADWPYWGGDAGNTHFAAGEDLSAGDVGRLRLAWRRSEGPLQGGWETFPVVVGRTLYYTTNTDAVFAVDAATGRLRWSYTPRVDFLAGPDPIGVRPTSRGVAVGAGRVYDLTYDDRLIALDAGTGAVLWHVRIGDPSRGDAENSPGTYWRGEVIVGGPAGDTTEPGFIAAYSARTGHRLWRTRLVGGSGHGRTRGREAYGGGHVWMPPTVDPRTGTVYAATGNPTPAFRAASRAGCDRWTDATVALDARTGRLRWGYSELCGDAWDYDTVQSPMVFDLRRGGRLERVVGDASKAGFYVILDARTGALVARSRELVRYSQPHQPPSATGTVVCPGIFGGIGYGPAAFSPRTGAVYVLGTNSCMRLEAASARPGPRSEAGTRHRAGPGRRVSGSGLGGTAVPLGRTTGVIAAIDPGSGQVRWRRRLPGAAVGGVLATAGGLVIAGDDDGYLYVFAARSGRLVRRIRVGLRFGSAPIAYRVGGRRYLAVVAGGSAIPGGPGAGRGGEIEAFSLGR